MLVSIADIGQGSETESYATFSPLFTCMQKIYFLSNVNNPVEFSLNGDVFCRFYRITRKTKKIQQKNIAPNTIRSQDLSLSHSALYLPLSHSNLCCQEEFKWPCNHAVLILGLSRFSWSQQSMEIRI